MIKRRAFVLSIGLLMFIGLAGTTIAVWAQSGDKGSNDASVGSLQEVQPVVKTGDKSIQEVNSFIAQWSASLETGPGWIHVVSRHDRNKDRAGVLPNGEPIPLDYISDTWYQIDDKNAIVARVAVLKTFDDRPWQTSTFRDGVSRNLTLGEKMPGMDAPILRLDFGFSANLAQASSAGEAISRQEQDIAGNPVVIYSIQDGSMEPTHVQGYTESIMNSERRAGFNPKTGQMIFLERLVVLSNGERRIAERVDLLTAERVDAPPAQVLDLLNTEVSP